MYKLNVDSINEVKYSNTDEHGLFSGTIETDRVVLVNGDGAYLQTDGNFGTDLRNGLVRTWSATRDSAETTYLIATTNATTTAAVFCYADIMVLQSDYADVDAFVEYLVDNGIITIDDYENPKYELKAATIKTAGTGYTAESVDVEVPGEAGDTPGVVTCTIKSGAIFTVAIKTAGSYETMVASQSVEVAGGKDGAITVTMREISEGGTKGLACSAPVKDDKFDSESEEEPEVTGIKEDEVEIKSEVEQEVEPEAEQEVEQEVEQPTPQVDPQPDEEPESDEEPEPELEEKQ